MRSLNIILTVLPSCFRSSLAQTQSITDIAIAEPDLSKLVEIAIALDVVDLIGNCALGPFTVFAPTDAAFEDFGEGLLNDIIADTNSDDALDIFSFHVVLGKQLSSDFTDGTILRTLNGKNIKITSHEEGTVLKVDPSINGGRAKIVSADNEACNGIIHIIDAVLDLDGELKPESDSEDIESEDIESEEDSESEATDFEEEEPEELDFEEEEPEELDFEEEEPEELDFEELEPENVVQVGPGPACRREDGKVGVNHEDYRSIWLSWKSEECEEKCRELAFCLGYQFTPFIMTWGTCQNWFTKQVMVDKQYIDDKSVCVVL